MSRLMAVVVLSFLACAPVYGDVPRNLQETVEYLQSLQTADGGFRPQHASKGEKPHEPTLRATSSGIRALKYFGGKVPNVKAARQFVARCHDAQTGGFADTPGGTPDVFATAVGVMAVVELGMPVEKYRPGAVSFLEKNAKSFEDIRIAAAGLESLQAKSTKAEQWIKEIRQLQNPDGTFGKGDAAARFTGGAVAAILRLGGKIDQRDNIIETLRDGQQRNGGYGEGKKPNDAELPTTYRVMRTFYMLKALPDDPEGVRSFVEKCRNVDGGYGVAPTQPSNLAGTYYAAMIHYWLKKE